MKKVFVIFLIFLCIGCKKEEKNIVINIYENNNDIELKSEKADNYSSTDDNKNKGAEDILNTSEKEKNEETQKSNSKVDNVKSWYNENKEELKEKSNEILKNDVDKLKDLYDKAKDWYGNNEDEIKETTSSAKDYIKDQYNSDKDKLIDFWNNITN